MPLLDTITPSLPLILNDYFKGLKELDDLYAFEPSLAGLKKAANIRKEFPVDRKVLQEVLFEQAKDSAFSDKATIAQIERLQNPEVFTITTGHQLCLFGGPLFFLYKIMSTIRLCQTLEEKGIQTVPVFWMASEDHDFEEINHIHLNGTKYNWQSPQEGPVGRMKLEGLDDFINALKGLYRTDPAKLESIRNVEGFFSTDKTLAQGVRDFVYALFSGSGIIVLDADDKRLKRLFKREVTKDVFDGASFKAVSNYNERLTAQGYTTQVTPREINHFWMEDGYRERIVKAKNGFATADGEYTWSAEELAGKVDESPECFSPNVIMRPLYQETILPNLAYIGGPGELSYWLQLKGNFDQADTFYPVLILRDMIMLMDEKAEKRMGQLGLKPQDAYQERDALFTRLVREVGTHEHLVSDAASSIEAIMSGLIDQLNSFDPTMEESAKAERQRILNRLVVLQKKVLRNERKQNAVVERQLDQWLDIVKPNGSPQERVTNWLEFYTLERMKSFISESTELFDPLSVKVRVLT